jgi:hypothetical protein
MYIINILMSAEQKQHNIFIEETSNSGAGSNIESLPTRAMSERTSSYSSTTKKKGLTVFGASLAILSTIIGGGIVGLPYSFFHTGIPLGVILNLVISAATLYSCILYMKAKNLVGESLSSFSEIGYLLIGRKSVFVLNTIIFIGCF